MRKRNKFIFTATIVILLGISLGIYSILKNTGSVAYQNNGTVQEITFQELKAHNTSKDCWILVTASVYDITAYLQDNAHSNYASYCGTDATKNILPNAPGAESQKTFKTISQFNIGIIVPTN